MVAAQDAGSAGSFYQRNGHPTINAVEERLAALEGAEASLLFPSGMGAISSAFLGYLKSGDHVVCVDPCYGGTQALLQWGKERFGWDHTFVDSRKPETWEAAFKPNTRLLHLESPINPDAGVLRHRGSGQAGTCEGRVRHHRQHDCLAHRPAAAGARLRPVALFGDQVAGRPQRPLGRRGDAVRAPRSRRCSRRARRSVPSPSRPWRSCSSAA